MDYQATTQSVAVFAPEPASIPAARRFVRSPAEEFVAHRVDDILLAVSELATNAVEYGSSAPFEVRFVHKGDVVELTVSSSVANSSSPPAAGPPPTSEKISRSGRGLGIVKAISDGLEIRNEDGHFRARCRFNMDL